GEQPWNTCTLLLRVGLLHHLRRVSALLSAVCDCNGMSRQCIFDWQLLRDTGNGFRCLGCQGHTEGVRCERCQQGFYRQHGGLCCLPCLCHPWGTCTALPGLWRSGHPPGTGFKTHLPSGVITNSQSGVGWKVPVPASPSCLSAGSLGPQCDSDGRCSCKPGVMGDKCDQCKRHFYNLDARNPAGCSPCFCYGHSDTCVSADTHSVHNITSTFQQGAEGWRGVHESGSPAQLQWSPRHQDAFIAARTSEPIYFMAPAKFLGNQQLSYGQTLSFGYRLDRGGQQPSPHDVVLEGHGLRVTAPFLPQGEVLPCGVSHVYTFRLDEHPSSKWSPRLNHFEFRRLLGNLTALWIRATFGEYSKLECAPCAGCGAGRVEPLSPRVTSCAPGYRRDSPSQGPFSSCVPCNCQGGGTCDPDTGECYSGDEHVGNGASCPFGSYRDPQQPHSCRPCPCGPGQGCSVGLGGEEIICDHCPPGATGANCEYCADGYFGDPAASQPCQPCRCNGNVEPNAVGNCDRQTGECLKCLHNTAGFYCDHCKDGFFGNPLAPDPAHKCRACDCDSVGAEPLKCRSDGSCICKPGFEGPRCEESECPACYGQVKEQVELYLQQLAQLELLLSEVRAGGGTNQELEGRMLVAEEMLRTILRETLSLQASDRSLEGRVVRMKGQGSSSQSRLDEVKATVESLRSLGRQYERQVQETRQLLERARLDLDRSGAALLRVVRASRVTRSWFSSGREKNLQRKAAREDARQALELLRAAAGGEGTEAPPALASVSLYAPGREQGMAKNPGPLPSLPPHLSCRMGSWRCWGLTVSVFQEEASRLKQDSGALLALVDTSLSQYRGLRGRVGQWEQEAKELLQGVGRELLKLTQLLSRATLARSTALQAVSTGNATFYEVEQILKSLKEFNLQADDKRRQAKDAMRRLPIISSMVTTAREKTDQAKGIVGRAASDSLLMCTRNGFGCVLPSKSAFSSTQPQEIARLREEANKTADGVLALEKAVATLQLEAKEVDEAFERKLSEAEADTAQEAQRVHDKAGQAGAAVQQVLSALEELLRLMNQPGAVDEDGLRQLEENFSKAQSRSKQLKKEMSELEQTAALQKARVQTLESSIDGILADIKNLEDIQKSLPPGCYNTKAIELP
uniref:Laminin subunit gamma 2 n=1 Tax=Zonotrichia albicollis TaxID=44394 RepID=A0A8D2NA49_ZONAL